MKLNIQLEKVGYQVYLLPFIKVTHDTFLNGDYELIIGWFNRQVSIALTPKD